MNWKLWTLCLGYLAAVSHTVTFARADSHSTEANNFTHSAVLDEYGRFTLFWKFDAENITFEVRANTSGWVGLGFSPNGGMPGSDIVTGWVQDGEAYLQVRRQSCQ